MLTILHCAEGPDCHDYASVFLQHAVNAGTPDPEPTGNGAVYDEALRASSVGVSVLICLARDGRFRSTPEASLDVLPRGPHSLRQGVLSRLPLEA